MAACLIISEVLHRTHHHRPRSRHHWPSASAFATLPTVLREQVINRRVIERNELIDVMHRIRQLCVIGQGNHRLHGGVEDWGERAGGGLKLKLNLTLLFKCSILLLWVLLLLLLLMLMLLVAMLIVLLVLLF